MKRMLSLLILCTCVLFVSCAAQVTASPLVVTLDGEPITLNNISMKFLALPGAHMSGLGQFIIMDGTVSDAKENRITVDIGDQTLVINGDPLIVCGPTATTVISGETWHALGQLPLNKELVGKPINMWVTIRNGEITFNLKVT